MTEFKDGRRYFTVCSGSVLSHLRKVGKLRPCNESQWATRCSDIVEGHYLLRTRGEFYDGQWHGGDLHRVFIRDIPGEWAIYTSELRKVYREYMVARKYINSLRGPREIIQPILPQATYDRVQTTVFDFFKAIDSFGTNKGFGNVGIILTGPAGVGKTETMRWIAEVAAEHHNRGSFKLSYNQLLDTLSKGKDMNNSTQLIFIDDIEASLLRDRRKQGSHPLTSQFLTCLDGLDKHEGRVFIVSTNETVNDLDPAITRPGRFETLIKFDYPTPDLIRQFCEWREVQLDPERFMDWSFARIDLFISRYKVAKFISGVSMDVFYEKFIHDMGIIDETVAAYAECEV